MKVLFLETRIPQAADAPTYEAGRVYDLPTRSVEHWLMRGGVTTDPQAIRAAEDRVRISTNPAWFDAKSIVIGIVDGEYELVGDFPPISEMSYEAMDHPDRVLMRSGEGVLVTLKNGAAFYRIIEDDPARMAVLASLVRVYSDAPPAESGHDAVVPDTAPGAPPIDEPLPDEAQPLEPIPDNWRDLTWPQMRSLASKVSDGPIRNGADAERAIEAEIARREAAV